MLNIHTPDFGIRGRTSGPKASTGCSYRPVSSKFAPQHPVQGDTTTPSSVTFLNPCSEKKKKKSRCPDLDVFPHSHVLVCFSFFLHARYSLSLLTPALLIRDERSLRLYELERRNVLLGCVCPLKLERGLTKTHFFKL